MSKKKRNVIIFIILLIVILLIVAFFCFKYFKNRNIEVNTNYLTISEMGKPNKADYENYGPLDDEHGYLVKPYQFSIRNDSEEEISHYIIIEDIVDKKIENQLIEREYFHYQLLRDDQIVNKGSLKDIHDNILYKGIISGKEKNKFSLRIWLSKEAQQIDWMDKYYSYNLNVVATDE